MSTRKAILVYDINVFPEESILTIDKVMEIYHREKILFWDSRGSTPGVDCCPKIYNIPKESTITILDTNSEAGKAMLKTLE